MKEKISKADLDKLIKALVDDGKLIEAGWFGLRNCFIPPDASDAQIHEMRKVYFAGAQHLFASIMTQVLLRRVSLISEELIDFHHELESELV